MRKWEFLVLLQHSVTLKWLKILKISGVTLDSTGDYRIVHWKVGYESLKGQEWQLVEQLAEGESL